MTMKENISKNLRTLRKAKGYTQSDVANMVHVTRQMYLKYEHALVEPSLETIMRLAGLYKVSLDELVLNEQLIKFEV